MGSSRWDELLRKDTSGKLIQLMNETVDGDYQTFKSKMVRMFANTSSVNILKPQHWLQTGLTSRSGH